MDTIGHQRLLQLFMRILLTPIQAHPTKAQIQTIILQRKLIMGLLLQITHLQKALEETVGNRPEDLPIRQDKIIHPLDHLLQKSNEQKKGL